jgi:hypothetical protein
MHNTKRLPENQQGMLTPPCHLIYLEVHVRPFSELYFLWDWYWLLFVIFVISLYWVCSFLVFRIYDFFSHALTVITIYVDGFCFNFEIQLYGKQIQSRTINQAMLTVDTVKHIILRCYILYDAILSTKLLHAGKEMHL